jgi:hypothetical protein
LEKFIARYRSLVTGVLSGFDRLVFRGSLLPLFRDGGMFFFLERAGVRLLDFKDFVTRTSDRVKEAAYAEAARLGRPVQYLESSESDKEKIAKRMLADQPIDRGLICVLTAVEPCMSFEYHRSSDPKERGLRLQPEEVLAPLQVLRPSPVRFHERAAADVVPLQRADLPQPSRVGRAGVMRFLGQKVHGNFTGEIITSFKNRPEGVRAKHWVRGNSIKMYDKAGSILRIETTIARTKDFKVLRPAHDEPNGKLEWRPLRKGVADLHRRAQLSQRSNKAYLDALSAVEDTTPCAKLFDAVSSPVFENGRRFRALRLNDPADLALLDATSQGEFAPAGFRNRDLRGLLYRLPAQATPRDHRRLSAKVSRQLRLLRAHGAIKRIPKTHRYRLTSRGLLLTAALQATRRANIKDLLKAA